MSDLTDLHPRGAQNLIEAIVVSAVKDWRSAMRVLRKRPDSLSAERNKGECERFFRSEYFYSLTGLDGRQVLDQLYKEFNDHD